MVAGIVTTVGDGQVRLVRCVRTVTEQSGALQILDSIDYLEKKEVFERELLAWVNANPQRAKMYAPVIAEMDRIQSKYQENWQKRVFISRLFSSYFNGIASSALTLVRVAKEK